MQTLQVGQNVRVIKDHPYGLNPAHIGMTATVVAKLLVHAPVYREFPDLVRVRPHVMYGRNEDTDWPADCLTVI